jgi:hypothetical protein
MSPDIDSPVVGTVTRSPSRSVPAYPFDWDDGDFSEPVQAIAAPAIEPIQEPLAEPIPVQVDELENVEPKEPPALPGDLVPIEKERPAVASTSQWTSREIAFFSILAFCTGGVLVALFDRSIARATLESDRAAILEEIDRVRSLVAARPAVEPAAHELGLLTQDVATIKDSMSALAKAIQEIAAVKESITSLAKATREIASAKESMSALAKALPDAKGLGAKIDALGARLDSVVVEMGELPGLVNKRIAMRVPYNEPEPTREPAALVAALNERGVSLYAQGSYADANACFRSCRSFDPSDPLPWYFGALAHGFATDDWQVESVRLAQEGVKRESGKPEFTAKVKAALSSLTAAKGGDWLAFYRKGIAAR